MHLPVHKYFNVPENRHVKVTQPEYCCLGQQQIFFLPVFYFQQKGYIIFISRPLINTLMPPLASNLTVCEPVPAVAPAIRIFFSFHCLHKFW